jgi:hypothetical protein
MRPTSSFTQQFFALSSVLPDNRVLLAGGLDPIVGQRSAYRASVACYDYAAHAMVWLREQTKRHPFRAVAHVDGVCAALLPSNFVREPLGLFRFDLATGDPLLPDSVVSGWKIESVDPAGESFLFSWVSQETSRLRLVKARDGSIQERSFPYHSVSSGDKTLERVVAASDGTFVAHFNLVKGSRVVYSAECWSLDSATPLWMRPTTHRQTLRNADALLLWTRGVPKQDVEILSLDTGAVIASLPLKLADVVDIVPIDAQRYALLALSGAYVLDASSQALTPIPGMGPDDFLDFGALAVDAAQSKLLVITAGNNRRPGTNLMLLDL